MSLLDGPKGHFVLIDYAVSALALVGNLFALEGVLKVQFDLSGYRRFLISLIISDIYIVMVNVATFFQQAFSASVLDKCSSEVLRSMQLVGFIANLLNLCGMSIDHYLGILHPLRYREFMSKRVTGPIVIGIWVISSLVGFADVYLALIFYFAGSVRRERQVGMTQLTTTESERLLMATTENTTTVSTTLLNSLITIFAHKDITLGQHPDLSDASAFFMTPPTSSITLMRPITVMPFEPAAITSYSKRSTSSRRTTTTPFPMDDPELAHHENLFDKLSPDIDAFLQSIMSGNDSMMGQSGDVIFDSDPGLLGKISEPGSSLSWCSAKLESVWVEFCVMTLTIFCFVFLTVCYGRIFKEVFVNYRPTEGKMRRLVLTTCLLLGSFIICWVPFMSFEFTMIIVLHTDFNVNDKSTLISSASFFAIHNAFNTLLMCSPLFDPIIYAARMRIVRRYILMRYGRIFPCVRPYLDRVSSRQKMNMTTVSRLSVPCGEDCNAEQHGLLCKKGSQFNSRGTGLSVANSASLNGAVCRIIGPPEYTLTVNDLVISANHGYSNGNLENGALIEATRPAHCDSLGSEGQLSPVTYNNLNAFRQKLFLFRKRLMGHNNPIHSGGNPGSHRPQEECKIVVTQPSTARTSEEDSSSKAPNKSGENGSSQESSCPQTNNVDYAGWLSWAGDSPNQLGTPSSEFFRDDFDVDYQIVYGTIRNSYTEGGHESDRFPTAQAVLDKFYANSARLFGFSTSGDDEDASAPPAKSDDKATQEASLIVENEAAIISQPLNNEATIKTIISQ